MTFSGTAEARRCMVELAAMAAALVPPCARTTVMLASLVTAVTRMFSPAAVR
jgi:hypothetical protein